MKRLAGGLVAALAAGCGGPASGDGGAPSCTFVVPDGATEAPARGTLTPGGQRLTPMGQQVELGGFAFGVAVVPGTKYVIVGDAGYGPEALRVVDTQAASLAQSEQVTSHFLGLAVTTDGTRLYASSPNDAAVLVFSIGAGGALTKIDSFPGVGLPAGLALSADGTRLWVADQLGNHVFVLDALTGAIDTMILLGGCNDLGCPDPYRIVVAPSGKAAYATLWGGGAVAVLDQDQPAPLGIIAVGENPTGIAISADGARLYVTCANDDTVAIVDPTTQQVLATQPLDPGAPPGLYPSDIVVAPDGKHLYVAAAGANAVYVLAGADAKPLGAIPVGWYPASLAWANGVLAVANAKGGGMGPNDAATYIPELMVGTLTLVAPPPDDADLAPLSALVEADAALPAARQPEVHCSAGATFPLPLTDGGAPSPIEHVILLVRENKTYDAELGDLQGANGDPKLVLYPEKDTPNLHALARQFTNLDNFYSGAEASIQGHAWTTGSTANDYIEKAWFTLPGYRADLRSEAELARGIARPRYGSIFEVLDANKVSFVVWGEFFAFRTELGANFDGYYPGGPFFDLDVLDGDKAAYVVNRIQNEGFLPRFSYLLLPRNHTYAMKPGKPSPEAMVAENDAATGQLIDGLSRSKFWPSTVVFLVEDDPQDGGDHVEAHRSPCLVISPWARHGTVLHTRYDVASVYRTIELLLGLGPMNRADARAAIMVDAFADQSNLTPYAALPAQVPTDTLNPASGPGARESDAMDFSGPDRAPGLGRVVWRALKGSDPPFAAPPDDDHEQRQ